MARGMVVGSVDQRTNLRHNRPNVQRKQQAINQTNEKIRHHPTANDTLENKEAKTTSQTDETILPTKKCPTTTATRAS
jgi:hypothetical protein